MSARSSTRFNDVISRTCLAIWTPRTSGEFLDKHIQVLMRLSHASRGGRRGGGGAGGLGHWPCCDIVWYLLYGDGNFWYMKLYKHGSIAYTFRDMKQIFFFFFSCRSPAPKFAITANVRACIYDILCFNCV